MNPCKASHCFTREKQTRKEAWGCRQGVGTEEWDGSEWEVLMYEGRCLFGRDVLGRLRRASVAVNEVPHATCNVKHALCSFSGVS